MTGKQDSVDYFWFVHAANMEKEGKAEREQLEDWNGFQVIRFNLKGPTPEFFYFLMDRDWETKNSLHYLVFLWGYLDRGLEASYQSHQDNSASFQVGVSFKTLPDNHKLRRLKKGRINPRIRKYIEDKAPTIF